MSRAMPVECAHGCILDWGDFGVEGAEPEYCEICTPAFTPPDIESDYLACKIKQWVEHFQSFDDVHPDHIYMLAARAAREHYKGLP